MISEITSNVKFNKKLHTCPHIGPPIELAGPPNPSIKKPPPTWKAARYNVFIDLSDNDDPTVHVFAVFTFTSEDVDS